MADCIPGSDMSNGSDSDFDMFCQPCSEDSRILEAEGYCMDCKEYLCKDCYDNHRKPRPIRNHVLFLKDEVPQRALKPNTNIVKDPCSITCDKHPQETFKFYCKKHDAVCCSVCVTLLHSTCKVEYIPDTFKDNKDTLKKVDIKLNELTGKIASIDKRSKNNLKNIQDIYNDVIEAVQTLRKDINEMIDKMEEKIREDADSLRAADTENIESIAQTCANIKHELKTTREHLNTLQKSNQENNLFVQTNITKRKLRELQLKLKDLTEDNNVIYYSFERTEDVWDFVNNTDAYGHLRQICTGRKGLDRLEAKHLKDIALKLKEDKADPTITGSVILPGNLLVLIDYFNQKLKVFDCDSSKIVSTFTLDGHPWDTVKPLYNGH